MGTWGPVAERGKSDTLILFTCPVSVGQEPTSLPHCIQIFMTNFKACQELPRCQQPFFRDFLPAAAPLQKNAVFIIFCKMFTEMMDSCVVFATIIIVRLLV